MTRKKLDQFPQDEQDDFYAVCKRHNIDPATLEVWADEEYVGTGPAPIRRMVHVKRAKRSDQDPAVTIDVGDAKWITDFDNNIGLLR